MIDNCYTFAELKEKFGWDTTLNEISKQVIYAGRRGVQIEKAFKKGPTYFRVIQADAYPNEIWKTHPKKELYLEVSNLGRIRDLCTKAFIGYENNQGYIEIKRYGITYRAHRLILETFQPIENSAKYFVDHIDGIRSHNELTNLRWVKASENLLFRNENWQDLSEIYQNLLQKYGYEGTKKKLLALLDEK